MNPNVKEWKVSVLGAGTMGLAIAQFFAMHGHTTYLYNRTPANLEKAKDQIKKNLQNLQELGETTEEQNKNTLANLNYFTAVEPAVVNADIVIETVSENAELKKDMFSILSNTCSEDTIFTSDTSSMNIYDFIEVKNPERVVITHFFNPAYVMPLVEIVRGPKTSDKTVNAVKELLITDGKTPAVLNKVIPGFILNRINLAIVREMTYMVEQGWTTPADIDAAIISTFGPRYTFEGPFGLCDFAGLDMYYDVASYLIPQLSDGKKGPELFKEMVQKGKLGVKTNEGFYKYDDVEEARRNRDKTIIKMIQKIREVK